MKSKQFILITIIFSLIAFLLTPVLWPYDPMNSPSSNLMPFFMIYSLFESVAFGFGVAFLLLFWKKWSHQRVVFLAVVWSLISWWPHDNFHRVLAHDNYLGLLYLEYGFHLSLIIAGIILAIYLIKTAKVK